jgi:hypothetical protein
MMSDYFVLNKNNFVCLGINYERDEYSGRCYRMEPSISLRREMDGALVRRRISKTVYEKEYQACKAKIAEHEAWKAALKQDKGYQACKARIAAAKVWEADLEQEHDNRKTKTGKGSRKKTEYDQELFPAEQYPVKKTKKPELKPGKKYSLFK